MRRVWIALSFSLLAHSLSYEGIRRLPLNGFSRISQGYQKPLQVEIIDNRPYRDFRRQVVMDSLVPQNQLTQNDDWTKFLSRKRQRVKEETKASRNGLTWNQLVPSANPQKRVIDLAPKKNTSSPIAGLRNPFGNVLVQKGEKAKGTSSDSDTNDPVKERKPLDLVGSQVNENLENVKIGDFTALNTDQFTFYTYYSRINSQIRFHWEKFVEGAIEDTNRRNLNLPRISEWVTQVTIYLNSAGYFVSSEIDHSSGLAAFDQAAANAFKTGAPYLNPPKEIVQDDGLIHLHYEFHVYWTPQVLASPKTF